MDHGPRGRAARPTRHSRLKTGGRSGIITRVTTDKSPIDFEDIMWLRKAATKSGADHVPPAIAEKLINAGYIEVSTKPATLRITEKGRIALTKLG